MLEFRHPRLPDLFLLTSQTSGVKESFEVFDSPINGKELATLR